MDEHKVPLNPHDFKPGRRFKVVKRGASLVHGDFGAGGGSVPLEVGAVLTFGRWLTNRDGDGSPIWSAIDGRRIKGIGGVDPYFGVPWAVLHPELRVPDGTTPSAGWCFTMPHPDYLEPISDVDNQDRGPS